MWDEESRTLIFMILIRFAFIFDLGSSLRVFHEQAGQDTKEEERPYDVQDLQAEQKDLR